MAKKVLFIGEMPILGAEHQIATLCGISPEKFKLIFDYATLFTKEVPWHEKDAAMRATMLLQETPHLMLVFVGLRVAKAFGVENEPLFKPFALAEGEEGSEHVFGAVKIVSTEQDRFYRKDKNRLQAKSVLSDLVMMSQLPSSPEDARVCCKVVREALGENMSFWTRKHVEDIEKKLDNDELVDKHDLGGLMAQYAKDVVKWVNK